MGEVKWPTMAWKSNLIEGKERVPWILKYLQVLQYMIEIDKYR
jgi:hypothetical protein